LTHLYLGKNQITEDVFEIMESHLSMNQKLVYLDLSSNKINSTVESTQRIMNFMNKNNKLRTLDLSNNHITDIKFIIKNLEKVS